MNIYLKFINVILCVSLFAQQANGQSLAHTNSLLWEVSGKDLNQASYLFGTMHLICKEDYIWTDSMQYAFDQCEQVLFEMDISDPQLFTEGLQAFFDFSGKQLQDYFDNKADYTLLAHYIQDSMGQDISRLQQMKPIGVYMLVSMGALGNSCTESVSYELLLSEQALKKHKTVKGLETLQDQIKVLESTPVDSILQELVSLAKGLSTDGKSEELLTRLYHDQKLRQLDSLIQASSSSGAINMDKFIDDRNAKWIPKMLGYMQKQSAFFAVGAGHISGLLRLLEKEGYTLRPVEPQ